MIDPTRKYVTRSGLAVRRVLCLDRAHHAFPVVAEMENGDVMTYTLDGNSSSKHSLDLIEVSPYADFMIDEPVMVRTSSDSVWSKGHFAGVGADGRATTWYCGTSSWSTFDKDTRSSWKECRRPVAEELKE